MLNGCDYSYQHPDPAGLAAAGIRFVVRYLGDGGPGKALTPTEAAELRSAAVDIVAGWESTAQRAKDGRAAGIADAQSALRESRRVGMPLDRPIYFAVDWDWQSGDAAAVQAYFEGIATVLPPSIIGMYGGYAVIAWAYGRGLAAWYWQTYAWSHNTWAGHVNIEQHANGVHVAGGDVDLDWAITPDYGGWSMSTPAGQPPTAKDIATAVVNTPDIQSPVPNDPTPTWTVEELLNYLGRDVRASLAEITQAVSTLQAIQTALGGLKPDETALAAALATDPTFVTSLAAALAAHIANGPDPDTIATATVNAYVRRLEQGAATPTA